MGAYGPYLAIDIEASYQNELIEITTQSLVKELQSQSSLIIKEPDTAGKTCSVGYREMLVIG